MEENGMHSHAEHGNEKKKGIMMNQKEKPLLVMEYETGKVLWRLFFPNGIGVLFFGFMAIHEINESTKFDYNLESITSIAFFSFIALSSLFLSVEILLVKEIRFYIDKIEKQWSIFGTKSEKFSNLKLRGRTTRFGASKFFIYLHKPKWYKYKCCGYDENLISKDNKEKAIDILATVSNRNREEFTKTRIEINPLINMKELA